MTRHAQSAAVILLSLLGACVSEMASGQTKPASADSPYAASWKEMLHLAADGHSPTPEEISAAGSPSAQPAAEAVAQAVPFIRKALVNSDTMVRAYALTALTGLEIQAPPSDQTAAAAAPASTDPSAKPEAANQPSPAKGAAPPPSGPGLYSSGVATALAPAIPDIGRDLTDDSATNRILAATVLAGFAPHAPTSVYPPLIAYLKRDDGIGPTGAAVVDDLLLAGPVSAETASALVHYLHRSDQTADSRSSLIDSITSHVNQSQAVNQALLAYLDTDDPAVRARLILSLPQLDLAPDVFADTRARVGVLATNNQENLQVVNAAKAVTGCWTGTRMATGCPVY